MTDSMSSPTYPACVNVVQSQIANGTSKQCARVWANNVLPVNRRQHRCVNVVSWLSTILGHNAYNNMLKYQAEKIICANMRQMKIQMLLSARDDCSKQNK